MYTGTKMRRKEKVNTGEQELLLEALATELGNMDVGQSTEE